MADQDTGRDTPRAGKAEDNATTPLASKVRQIPIVIVPGVMGTRLSRDVAEKRKDGSWHNVERLVWNPTGGFLGDPGPSACDTRYLRDARNDAHPDTSNTFDRKKRAELFDRAKGIVNFYNLVYKFYGDLAFAMNEQLPGRLRSERPERNARPKVYGAGYDWRQPNSISAQRLRHVVDMACAECDGEQAILLAHSMGGLVSRFYCSKLGGEKNVRALFLMGSPTLGAPKAYSLLKAGLGDSIFDLDDYYIRKALLNLSVDESRDFLRLHASGYELVPTMVYGKNVDKAWLTFDQSSTGYPDRSVDSSNQPNKMPDPAQQFSNCAVPADKLYGDLYTGFTEAPATRAMSRVFVAQASQFHDGLTHNVDDMYMHPRTYCVYTFDMNTATGATVEFDRYTVDRATQDVTVKLKKSSSRDTDRSGDTKVPTKSSRPPKTSVPFAGTHLVSEVKHGGLANDKDVIQYLLRTIPPLV
jgi:pimeloyl-ACP methyl ester carboxylesterase